MRYLLRVFYYCLFFMTLSHYTLAQCPPGCSGSFPDCDPCEDPSVPIDGGVTLLVAAGVGFAFKKGLDMRNKKNDE